MEPPPELVGWRISRNWDLRVVRFRRAADVWTDGEVRERASPAEAAPVRAAPFRRAPRHSPIRTPIATRAGLPETHGPTGGLGPPIAGATGMRAVRGTSRRGSG